MRAPALALALGLVVSLASCAPQAPPVPAPAPPAPVPVRTPADTGAVRPAPSQPVPVPPVLSTEPLVTVGLAWDLNGVTIIPPYLASVTGVGERGLEPGENLAVTVESRRIVVRALGGGSVRWRATATESETLWVTPVAAPGGEPLLGWNGKLWRGQFKLFLNGRGRLTLASRMTLETYLLGVVPAEIGALADSLLEAGRAQAIAARSFTLFYKGRRGVEGFDLFATVEDQVYHSTDGERALATRCVQSTAGLVAIGGGEPIRANYCSTCGGITADVWEAWPDAPRPYLVGRRDRDERVRGNDWCAASRHHRWREEWTSAAFLAGVARFAPQFGVPLPRGGAGRLTNVRVLSRSRSGRVWRLLVETTTGRIVIPAHALRQVIRRPGQPQAILRSCLFKVDVRRDANGRALAVVVSGAGSGHGVGLCQTGALGMARGGRTAEDILRHYYRGVTIRRMY